MCFRSSLPKSGPKISAVLITARLAKTELNYERLEECDVLGFCWLPLIVGNETTTNLIGNNFRASASPTNTSICHDA
jgi:hypothetical protein